MFKHKVDYYEAFDVKPDGVGITTVKSSLGKFTKESDALTVCKGKGQYSGQDGEVKKGTMSIVVYDNLKEYGEDKVTELYKRALSKLTDEEKAALGL